MILITGGSGMVGHSLRPYFPDAVFLDRSKYDLSDMSICERCFDSYRPHTVIHLAALVGGITDNVHRQYDYFYENVSVNTNVTHCCHLFGVTKLVAMSSTCAYPKDVKIYPMREEHLHDGPPEPTNMTYAYAKRMLQVQVDAARRQFGHKWTTLYCSNLYGPYDRFDDHGSHVIPSLISRMHRAKVAGDTCMTILGSGQALRQFTYVYDLARIIYTIVFKDLSGDYNYTNPLNVSIGDLASLVSSVVGFEGEIVFSGELEGVHRKDVDIGKLLAATAVPPFTSLQDGLIHTYHWYKERICGN